MRRSLSILIIFLSINSSFACEQVIVPDRFKAYFNSLNLPYKQPVGKIAFMGDANNANPNNNRSNNTFRRQDTNNYKGKPKCHISADLNDDGKADFAGLYKYSGAKKRVNNWSLDMVILYSSGNSIKHVIYPFSGQMIEKNASIKQYLMMIDPGEINLMPGRFTLNIPAIAAFRNDQASVIYYWNGHDFTQRALGIDD